MNKRAIAFILGFFSLTIPLFSISLEQNAITQGLVKIFPTLAEKESPYIDFDRSGDRRTEPGVPEIVWDRPGQGQGIIQAQEILDMVVYKNSFKYLSLKQLQEIVDLLTAAGKTTGNGEAEIMTRKVARSFKSELEGLIVLRKNLPDRVTKNEKEKVYADLKDAMKRMTAQFSKEADKEASATFKQDMEKFRSSVEVMVRAEKETPMEFPFKNFDDAKGSAQKVMVRIIADELLTAKEKNIKNDLAVFALGKLRGRNAMLTLQSVMQNPAYAENLDNTISALGMIGEETTPEIVNLIANQLTTSTDPKVRAAAMHTLGRVGTAGASAILKKYALDPPQGYANLQLDALKALVNIAENERKRGKSATELLPIFREFDKDDAIEEVLQAIKGTALVQNQVPYGQLNELIQKMKGNINPELVGEVVGMFNLVEKYNSGSHKRILNSGSAPKEIIIFLQACLTGDKQRYFREHQHIRIEIARLLKDIIVQAPLLTALTDYVPTIIDEHAELKQESAKLLVDASREYKGGAKSKTPSAAVPNMTYQAMQKHKDKKGLVREALKIIGKQKLTNPFVIDSLFEHLSDMDDQVVRQAIRALNSQINPQTVSKNLERPKALENVRSLILRSTAPLDIRVTAIDVAGKIGVSDANSSGNNVLKALIEVSADRKANEELKIAAFRAFTRLKEKQERDHKLWETMRDQIVDHVTTGTLAERKAAVEALGEMHIDTKEIRDALHSALAVKDNVSIYPEIIDALGNLLSDDSTEHIRNLLTAEQKLDLSTRQAAIRVLGNLGDQSSIDVLLDGLSVPELAETAERGLVQYEAGAITKKIQERLEKETNADVKRRLQRLAKN